MKPEKRELSCKNCKYKLFCEPYLIVSFDNKDDCIYFAENCRFYIEGKSMPSFLPLFFPRAFHIRNVKWEKWFEKLYLKYDEVILKPNVVKIKHKYRIAICRPYWKHLLEKFPSDWKHRLHKWTAGIILVDHLEPDGKTAFESHKNYILIALEKEIIVHKKYPKI